MPRSFSLVRILARHPAFAGLLVANFALGMAYSFVVPFLSMWGTLEVGMSPLRFSVFMTITSVCAILVTVGLARWSDTHIPRKTILILGASGGVLGYVGYAFVRDPVWLMVIGCTAIAIAAVNFSQLFAHVREAFDQPGAAENEGAFLMSVVRVCFSVAWTVGPALGAWVMGKFNYRGVFLGAAGLYFVFLIGVLCFVPRLPRHLSVRLAARQPVWRVLTRGDILASFIAFVVVFAAHAINMMNMPLTVTEVLHGTSNDVGIIFGIGATVEIPLMLWFGILAARGHQMGLIRIGAVATVGYFIALGFARSPWHLFLIQMLSGVSFAILTNVTILFYQDLLPGQAGLATTIFSNSLNVGNLLGYFAFGPTVERVGNRGTFFVCGILAAVTLVILCCYRPRPGSVAAQTAA